MRGKNRSRSTISQLPPEVRDVVDEMVKATNTCTLADIQKYLASLDVTLSLQAISTYSRKLLASLEDIRVTNERMNYRPKRKNENHRKFFQKLLDTGRFVWYIKRALRRRGRVVQSVRTLALSLIHISRGR